MASESGEMGSWWLPGTEESQVPGRLSYNPTGGYRLELDGCLGWERDGTVGRLSPRDRPYEMINGDTRNGEVTLLDGLQSTIGGSLTRPAETITGSRLLHGALFTKISDVGGIEARARLRNGVSWVDPRGLAVVDENSSFRTVTSQWTQGRRVDLDDGTELRIEQLLGGSGDGIRELTVSQDVQFVVATTERTFRHVDFFLDRLADVADLVTIGVGENALFDNVEILHPEVPVRNINNEPMGNALEPIVFKANWRGWVEPEPDVVHPSLMLFRAADLSDDDIRAWLAFITDHRLIVRNLVGMRYTTGAFIDDRVRAWTAALSDLEKVISRRPEGSRPSFRSQLEKTTQVVGTPFEELVGNVEAWCNEMRDLRHATAHTTRERSGAIERRYFLAESLYWLTVAAAMIEAGLPEGLVSQVLAHRSVRHVASRLRAT